MTNINKLIEVLDNIILSGNEFIFKIKNFIAIVKIFLVAINSLKALLNKNKSAKHK